MRLSEALSILQKGAPPEATPLRVFLVCSFTPLHLRTLLGARLQLSLPQHRIEIETGLYGDFWGSLERFERERADCAAIVLEWADLDARLSLRCLGGWRQRDFTELLGSVQLRIARIAEKIQRLGEHSRLAICLPTLPLPPIQRTDPTWSAGALDLQLRECLYTFATRIAGERNIR